MIKNILLEQMHGIMSAVEPLQDECWENIKQLIRVKKYNKLSYFAEEGDSPTDIAFICEGTFRAFYRTPDGIEYNKTFFSPNSFILALTSIVSKKPNQINIQALENSTVLQLNYNNLTDLYNKYHSLERMARKIIEYEWTRKEIREIRLVLNNATERYEIFKQEHPGLENKIPQYHIASYLGITPIQLSRIRAKKK